MHAFELNVTSLNNHIDPTIRKNAKKIVESLSLNQIDSFSYHGFPLGKFITVSVCSYLYRGTLEYDEKTLKVVKRFLEGMIILYHTYDSILRSDPPSIVIMTNGRFFWYKLGYEMCKAAGIPVITMDDFGSFGGTGNRWMFSHDVPIAELDLRTYWEHWKNIPLSLEENKYLDNNFIQGSTVNTFYHNNPENDWKEIARGIINSTRIIFRCFYSRILHGDSTAMARISVSRECSIGYFFTIDEYIRSNQLLIIRVHPAEKGIFGLPSFQKVKDEILINIQNYQTLSISSHMKAG